MSAFWETLKIELEVNVLMETEHLNTVSFRSINTLNTTNNSVTVVKYSFLIVPVKMSVSQPLLDVNKNSISNDYIFGIYCGVD